MEESVYWVLDRVKLSVERYGRATKKIIFQGSYDVWGCMDDMYEGQKIMKARLNEVRAKGLIVNESGLKEWAVGETWTLTELGEKYFVDYNNEKEKERLERISVVVDLKVVENEIISAIELTDTPDNMGPQSSIWDKVYDALKKIKEQSRETLF